MIESLKADLHKMCIISITWFYLCQNLEEESEGGMLRCSMKLCSPKEVHICVFGVLLQFFFGGGGEEKHAYSGSLPPPPPPKTLHYQTSKPIP